MEDRARERLAGALEGIEGWLSVDEAWQLHQEIRRLAARRPRPLSVVEIGSWKGRSAVAMGLGLRAAGGRGRIYAIDPQGAPFADNSAEFVANLERAGVRDLVDPVPKLSQEARPGFEASEIDLLFVDGAHDYASVARDLDDWMPLLADGGVLCANDLFLPGVSRALQDRILRVGSPFRRPRYVHNTLFFDHLPGRVWTGRDARAQRRCSAFLSYGRAWLRAWNRIKDEPRVPRLVRIAFYRPSARLLWELGPKPYRVTLRGRLRMLGRSR